MADKNLKKHEGANFFKVGTTRSGLGKLNVVMIDFFNYYSCAIDFKKTKLAKLF